MKDLKSSLLPGIFLNTQLSGDKRTLLTEAFKKHSLANHIYIPSSGTEATVSSSTKLVGISLHSMKVAAKSVVDRFGIESTDRWLLALPTYHVGGQSILARAAVSGMHIVESTYNRWDVAQFHSDLKEHQVTLTSLVPTQVYDLVINKMQPPECLRVLFVGGGSLSRSICEKAIGLGWPLVLTYGMTETSAMMATSSLLRSSCDTRMTFFPHIQWAMEGQRVKLFSSALFSHYLFVGKDETKVEKPFEQGWFVIDDNLDIDSAGTIEVLGRPSELVKVKGESVALASVKEEIDRILLQKNIKTDYHILAVDHDREGSKLYFLSTDKRDKEFVGVYNQGSMKYLQLEFKYVEEIPRTALGKVQNFVLLEKYFKD